MFETLKRLYLKGELSKTRLSKAVEKGWITPEQENQILALG